MSDERRHKFSRFLFFVVFFVLPMPTLAGVSLSEIMYDPAGADDGHEWVEVYNDGAPVDLSKWKLFEGGSNHGIAVYAGSATLSTGAYAVIADNPQKFLADWPSFSGALFDTAFSGGLNNTNGETLTLRDDTLADKDSVTYSPAWGASGDGNSIQKVGGSWVSATPTPGTSAGGGSSSQSNSNQSQTASTTQSQSQSGSSQTSNTDSFSGATYPVEPRIKIFAGSDRTVIVGASTVFSSQVTGLEDESIDNARVTWSFGNGDQKEGRSALYAFAYPGKYAVVADASSGIFSATARFTVVAVPAQVAITKVTGDFVEIANHSNRDLDLGMWQLTSDGAVFIFPAHTVVFANESVLISNRATGLAPSSPQAVSLLYPNGTFATAYGSELVMARNVQPAVLGASTVSEGAQASANPARQPAEPSGEVATSSTPTSGFTSMLPWLFGLGAVSMAGVGALLFLGPSKKPEEEYAIIEE